ncbi:MAG: hypothetical protein V1655_00445 [bacterium]
MHHLIFEGAELAGKSWLISRVYDFLETKYNQEKIILDGCHWFNSDVGIFGTENGKFCIEKYIEILEHLKNKNIIFEKLHISDIVYNRIYRNKELNYSETEKKLARLNTKIILCAFKEDEKMILKRIEERLNLYPHYKRILRKPKWYIAQQREYIKEIKKTKLPYLIIDSSELPGDQHEKILKWIGEIK